MNELMVKGWFYLNTHEGNVKDAIEDLRESYPGLNTDNIEYAILRGEDGEDIDSTIISV